VFSGRPLSAYSAEPALRVKYGAAKLAHLRKATGNKSRRARPGAASPAHAANSAARL